MWKSVLLKLGCYWVEDVSNSDQTFSRNYIRSVILSSVGSKWPDYTQNFDNEQHEQLALELQKVRGKFALSYYHFDKLEEWYPKSKFRYVTKSFNKQNSTKKKNTDRGDEILIMNY